MQYDIKKYRRSELEWQWNSGKGFRLFVSWWWQMEIPYFPLSTEKWGAPVKEVHKFRTDFSEKYALFHLTFNKTFQIGKHTQCFNIKDRNLIPRQFSKTAEEWGFEITDKERVETEQVFTRCVRLMFSVVTIILHWLSYNNIVFLTAVRWTSLEIPWYTILNVN